jgi:hypothetical protein
MAIFACPWFSGHIFHVPTFINPNHGRCVLLADEPLTAGLPHLDLVDDLVTIVHIIGAHQPTSHPPSKAPTLPQIVPFAGHLVGLLLHLNGRAASHRNRRYELKQKWIEGGFVVSAVTRQMPRTTQLWTDMHRNRPHLA